MSVRGALAVSVLTIVSIAALAGALLVHGALAEAAAGQGPAAATGVPSSSSTANTRTAVTQPLRWRVLYFAADNNNSGRDCQMYIVIRNVSGTSVSYEAEFRAGGTGSSIAIVAGSAGVSRLAKVISGTSDHSWPPYDPYLAQAAGLSANEGYANVHASDPPIMAEAVLICTTGGSDTILFVQPIQTLPVGATQEFFQASTPELGGDAPPTGSAGER